MGRSAKVKFSQMNYEDMVSDLDHLPEGPCSTDLRDATKCLQPHLTYCPIRVPSHVPYDWGVTLFGRCIFSLCVNVAVCAISVFACLLT